MIPFLLLTKLLHLFATLLETLFVSPTTASSSSSSSSSAYPTACPAAGENDVWSSSPRRRGPSRGGGGAAPAGPDPALLRRAYDLFEIRDDRRHPDRDRDPGDDRDDREPRSPPPAADDVSTASTMTRESIRRGWRRLATLHHPDRNGGGPGSVDAMRAVDECYDVLSAEMDRREGGRMGGSGSGGGMEGCRDGGSFPRGGDSFAGEDGNSNGVPAVGDVRNGGCCCAGGGGAPQKKQQQQQRRRGKKDSSLSSCSQSVHNGALQGGQQPQQPQQQQQQRQQKQRRKQQRNHPRGGGATKPRQNCRRQGGDDDHGPPLTEERRRMEREVRREWEETHRRTKSFRRELRRLARESREAARAEGLHTADGRDRAHRLWEEAAAAGGSGGGEGAADEEDAARRGDVAGRVEGWDDPGPAVAAVVVEAAPTKPVHPVMEYCSDPVAIALRLEMTDVAVGLVQEDVNRAAAGARSQLPPMHPLSRPAAVGGAGGTGAAEDMVAGDDPLLDYLGAAAGASGVDGAVTSYLLRPMDDDGNTLLHYAVYHENVDVIDLVARTARRHGGAGVGCGVGGRGISGHHGAYVRAVLARNDRGQIPADFARCCLRAQRSTDLPTRVARLTADARAERDDALLLPTARKTARRAWAAARSCHPGAAVHAASLYFMGTRWFGCGCWSSVAITAAARGVSRMEELGLRLDITRGGGVGGGVGCEGASAGGGDPVSDEGGCGAPPSPSSGVNREEGGGGDDCRDCPCRRDDCRDCHCGGGRSIVLALFLTLHLTWWALHGMWAAALRFVRWEAFVVAAPLACACCCCCTSTSPPPSSPHPSPSSSGGGGKSGQAAAGGGGGGGGGGGSGGSGPEDYDDDGLDLIDVALLVPTSILYLGLNCIHVLAAAEERIVAACAAAGGMAWGGLAPPLLFLLGGRGRGRGGGGGGSKRAGGSSSGSGGAPGPVPIPPAVAAGLERAVVLAAFAVWFLGFKYVVAAVRRNCVLRVFFFSRDDGGGGGGGAVGSSF